MAYTPSKAAEHFTTVEGPFAVLRCCNHCRHVEKVQKGLRGAGRGYGMREGNKARGRMIEHINTVHQDKLSSQLS
jgi:hypothetical protein